MKKLLFGALLLTLVAAGCALTDYPVISDSRGGFSGIIRTGHKAYVTPSISIGTIWSDGSDDLEWYLYQNQFGDQKIQTHDNFDPTASVIFLDQTFCDWRYSFCEIVRAWNPVNPVMDNIFDYEFFPDCQGARSLSLLLSMGSRIGECGDGLMKDKQHLAAEFANLATTTWRGGTAYIVPIDSTTTTITLNGVTMPLFGSYNLFITEQLQMVAPMTPNARHQLRWLLDYATQNGPLVDATITYGSVSGGMRMKIATGGLQYNLSRF